MNFTGILVFISTISLYGIGSAQAASDPPSVGENEPELMIFSGSDWCVPCMKLERNILSTEEFLDFANGRLTIRKVDFPQKKILSKEQTRINDSIAAVHNPKGAFPYVILLSPDREKVHEIEHSVTNPHEFIEQLSPLLYSDEIGTTQDDVKKEYRRKDLLMGSSFEFTIVHHDDEEAAQLLDFCVAEVKRLENLLSEWIKDSEVSKVNRAAGKDTVRISPEFYQIVKRSLEISRLTQGAFDISFRGLSVWEFDKKEHASLPSPDEIQAELEKVGYQKIHLLYPNQIYLEQEGMAIGFGASGKGFAADHLKKLLVEKGVESGVINASGDLITWGTRANGEAWNVGISDPNIPNLVQFGIPLSGNAIATSGNYEKYFTHHGKRYSHIIDPKTGYPVTDKKSVTIISPIAELSDGLATAMFVLDTELALGIINQLDGIYCIIIDIEDQIHCSNGLILKE